MSVFTVKILADIRKPSPHSPSIFDSLPEFEAVSLAICPLPQKLRISAMRTLSSFSPLAIRGLSDKKIAKLEEALDHEFSCILADDGKNR